LERGWAVVRKRRESDWLERRNERALARFSAALPESFPTPVLHHALSRAWTPELPSHAVESYWRAHPLRADRLARALAARSGAPAGWSWRCDEGESFRTPPAPYRDATFTRGPGHCCICGQPVFRFGWHRALAKGEAPSRARWHGACVAAWKFWLAPSDQIRLLKRIQNRCCAVTGGRLWRDAEVDHRVPLFRVWREHRDTAWPELLAFWGVSNLQVVNRDAHVEKCAAEAGYRANSRQPPQPPRYTAERLILILRGE
jgi:hypothetical protein